MVVKLLVVTNLFPPHQADSDDFHCQNVTDALRARGHTVRVLTSTYGLASDSGHTARNVGSTSDQMDSMVQRRLRLNGAFGLEPVTGIGDLRELEARNNAVLLEAIAEFEPDLVHVWSLRGLSKSLLLTLRRANLPVAFHISDTWLADELREDPWLSWWHREKVPALHKIQRAGLEISGQRAKWDAETRAHYGRHFFDAHLRFAGCAYGRCFRLVRFFRRIEWNIEPDQVYHLHHARQLYRRSGCRREHGDRCDLFLQHWRRFRLRLV